MSSKFVPEKKNFFRNYSNKAKQKLPYMLVNTGINQLGGLPKNIATSLNLPNADRFKGHSLRRTGNYF